MKAPDGIRPWKTQRDLPLTDVTEWEIDSYGAVDNNGRSLPRRRWKVTGSKAKAVAVRRSRIAELVVAPTAPEVQLEVVSPGGMTLAEYVATHFLLQLEDRIRDTTLKARERHLQKYILPLLGSKPLAEVNTPESIMALREAIKANARIKSTGYANQVLLTLSTLLSMASDPFTHSRPPLAQRTRIKLFKDTDFAAGSQTTYVNGFQAGHLRHKRLPANELNALITAVRGDSDSDFWLAFLGAGLFLGCRNGEACALSWKDIDFKNGTANVWSSIEPNTHVWVPRTKSLAGFVAIEPSLLEALKRLRKRAQTGYVLGPNEEGSPHLNTRNMCDRYKLLRIKAGLKPSYNYHALRHTFCSRLADAGFRVEEIQQLARHKSVKSTYGYITPDPKRLMAAANALSL